MPTRRVDSVFRSNKHIYAQVIDDVSRTTLVSASSQSEAIKGQVEGKKKAEIAEIVGQAIASECKKKKIESVVFDRNGFIYAGRIKALADGVREKGVKF